LIEHLSALFGSGGGASVQANVSGHFTGEPIHKLVLDERIVFTLVIWLTAGGGALAILPA
jgi:hypothetical protein